MSLGAALGLIFVYLLDQSYPIFKRQCTVFSFGTRIEQGNNLRVIETKGRVLVCIHLKPSPAHLSTEAPPSAQKLLVWISCATRILAHDGGCFCTLDEINILMVHKHQFRFTVFQYVLNLWLCETSVNGGNDGAGADDALKGI